MSKPTTKVGCTLGCLPIVLVVIILCALGFCGASAKQKVVGGLHDVREAVR